MKRYERSKSSMFLFEILINILLFSVLCVCSLQFFIHSYQLTEKTTILHHAVTACNNIAAVYQANQGFTEGIMETYPYALIENEQIYIYFDKNYQECDSRNICYYVIIDKTDSDIPGIHISFYKNGEDMTYSIDAYSYKPNTIINDVLSSSESEVASYE